MEVVEHRQERCGNASLNRSASKLLEAMHPGAASNPISMHRACLDNSTCRQEHALYRYEQTRQSWTCPTDRTSILLRYKRVIARALCKHMLFQQKHAQEV